MQDKNQIQPLHTTNKQQCDYSTIIQLVNIKPTVEQQDKIATACQEFNFWVRMQLLDKNFLCKTSIQLLAKTNATRELLIII